MKKFLRVIYCITIVSLMLFCRSSPVYKPDKLPVEGKGKYKKNIARVIEWLKKRYNPEFEMLQGARMGGEGLQTNGFSIINENFFASRALEPYEPKMAAKIKVKVQYYLKKVGYKGIDRREVLFGRKIPFPPFTVRMKTIEGCIQSEGCAFWIATELPHKPDPNYTNALNKIVPALLQKYLEGDRKEARRLFQIALSKWNGTGFLEAHGMKKNIFYTRALCYFLIARKATGFDVDRNILDRIEAQLWRCQVYDDHSLVTVYTPDGIPGEPIKNPKKRQVFDHFTGKGHTSIEINTLALLVYDPRFRTRWFNREKRYRSFP